MKKLIVFSIGLLSLLPLKAQQDPMFSQYLYNMLALNPAYAGSRDQVSSVLFYRNQWTGFEGAPVTYNASVHSPFRRSNGAWGINASSDKIGIQKENFINLNYAYRIIGPKGRLALGLSGGMYQYGYDYNELQLKGQGDPLFQGSESYQLYNFGFGAYYQTGKLALGLSVPHLVTSKVSDKEAFKAVNPVNHVFVTGSYLFFINDDYVFKPSMMLRYVNNAPVHADLNATLIYKQSFYFGLSYRTMNELSVMAQYQLNKHWWFGYAYDVPTGIVKNVSRGSHELFVGFEISLDKTKLLSPRYF
ncbi:MAG: type IX secretion system membrane protein PorP/SprF [Bacteroidota bacterium]|nr:type IX secretion system membrane protein PorP/SprF [Bacteroidota bacterium]MDX5431860.1 type IX secretion system membrane protein PorP/SprF [Bacteroidota bacterium]MDX5470571.1 type IX secretion system membrane protein PorP/SprF [Bacteroidota bacterium]